MKLDGWPVVMDDDGNYWAKCSSTCDLAVTSPGHVQCSGDCETLHGWQREDQDEYLGYGDRR